MINGSLRLPAKPIGSPSFLVVKNFLAPELVARINEDLNGYIRSAGDIDFVSDFGSRKNLATGGRGLKNILARSEAAQKFHEFIGCDETYKKLFKANLETLTSKGLTIDIDEYGGFGSEMVMHSPRWTPRWYVRKLLEVARKSGPLKKLIKLIYEKWYSTKGIQLGYSLSSCVGSYTVEKHVDNRYKILVGIIYLNTVDEAEGGQTSFWKTAGNDYLDALSYQIKEETITPEAGTLVLFANSKDGVHSVSKYVGDKKRNMIYLSYMYMGSNDVWNQGGA